MLRKGRNALSSATHLILNISLAIASTALTVISGSWILGIVLVLLSKWRVVAVRPRYWWLNLKANLVDYTVGISLVLLVYLAGVDGLNYWHVILTIIYAIWLVVVKPQSEAIWTEIQAFFAVFFGTFALAILANSLTPLTGAFVSFIIGYGASRHVLIQGEDRDFTLTTFIFGLILSELSWILYHWTIVYRLGDANTFAIPQFPIIAGLFFFVFMRGYKSALYHDGKIRTDDIVIPVIFSVILMFVMLFFFSEPIFNI